MEILPILEYKEEEATIWSMQAQSVLPSSGKEPREEEEAEPGPPHEALFFVLAYLPVFELLTMSEVCTSFRDAAKKDVLLWLDVIIESPLSSRLTDEQLLNITSRVNGRLQTLALINCARITDDGLQRVNEKNPFIHLQHRLMLSPVDFPLILPLCLCCLGCELYIPSCTGLTPEGIIRAVKALSQDQNCLKNLQISGIYNLKKEHLETLCSHLQMNLSEQKPQPILYHKYRTWRKRDSDRMIDVEICPKCDEVKMVFDCPKETCRRNNNNNVSFGGCRGCKFCIARCEECGECVDDGEEESEEAVCGDILCSACWICLPKCNLCNKPYCKRHANQQCNISTAQFVCDVCHDKSQQELEQC